MGGSNANALPANSRSTVSPFPPRYYNNNNLADHTGVVGGGSSNLNPTPAEAAQLIKSTHHHRCSSESILQAEEQPAWLDDLLDEPDSPLMYKGHRRSASDSYAYVDTMSVDTFNKRKESMFNNFSNRQQWKSSESVTTNSTDHTSTTLKATSHQLSFGGQQNWVSESSSIKLSNGGGLPPTRDGSIITTPTPQSSSSSSGIKACGGPHESDRTTPMMSLTTTDQKQDRVGSSGASQNPKNSGENGDYNSSQPNTTTSSSKADVKHAKQKTAHRSRVRKLQYIAELERNVQVLQAEGSAVFAEIEFLDQNNLILSMENRALRQRLDSLSQEQVIKQLQHEMLERELGRLQALLQFQMQQQLQQQQQQQQQQRKQQNPKNNNRAKYRDLDSQFSNFSLNQNEASASVVDSANSFVRI